jgi:hypothetical protein
MPRITAPAIHRSVSPPKRSVLPCDVELQAVYLDALPFADYTLDETDYVRLMEAEATP